MFHRILIFFLLLVAWVLFSGQLDVFHLTLGVLSAGFVTLISGDLYFSDREASASTRLKQGYRLAGYFLWMLWQIVLSNIHLLALAFGSKEKIQPSIICFRTNLKSDFEKFLLANSITLTPGTITVKIRGDQICAHSISEKTAAGLNDAEMERRIAAIFREESKESKEDAS